MNKKLLGLTALAALLLGGCNNTPSDTPTPDPEPTPATPTVSDLKTRLSALGETVKGSFTVKAGTITGQTDDVTVTLVQNANYNFLEKVGGIAKIAVDNQGGFYAVSETSATEFEADWGSYYSTTDEFKAGELVSNFATTIETAVASGVTVPYVTKKSVFNITSSSLCSDISSRLGYYSVFGKSAGKVEVSIADETKVVFSLYKTQTVTTANVVVEVSVAADASYAALDTWLSAQTELPTAPYTSTELLQTKLTNTKNFTREYSYGGDGYGNELLEHTYTTLNSQTVARDSGWVGGYASYAYFLSYFNVTNEEATSEHPNGVYEAYSYESVDPDVIKTWDDDSDFITVDGDDSYGQAPTCEDGEQYQSFWVNPNYVNETLAYNYGKYVYEAQTPFGQGFSVDPTLAFQDGTTLIEYYSQMFGRVVSVANHEKKYAGYDVTSWDGFYIIPEYSEDEQSVENVVDFAVVCQFTGSYWNTEKSYAEGSYYEYAYYYDFGTTVDEIGNVLIARETK